MMMDSVKRKTTIRAWDPLIRVFHWSLVFFFLVAFVTEDDWLDLHVQAGYAITLLLGFRLLWGLIGTHQAQFRSFVKPPRAVLAYLRSMLSLRPAHYLGHNPVAAVMVLALLLSLSVTCFTGLVTIASEGQGPLAATFFASWRGEWMEELHEFFANFTLLLVFGHVLGVVISSLLERENLVRAMITGRKKQRARWEDAGQQELNREQV